MLLQLNKALENARKEVRKQVFGTKEFEDKMDIVRDLCRQINALTVDNEEFCSVDSGIHRTRLKSGRIIG